MAIAIIPKDADPTGRRDGWLAMNDADKLVCEFYGEEPDQKWYCHNWFDRFYYFDWYNTKHLSNNNYSVEFKTADKAVLHWFKRSLYPPYEGENKTLWESVENTMLYVQKHIEPIIRLFYEKGYKIVSLNIG